MASAKHDLRRDADKVMTKAKTSESTYPYPGAHNVYYVKLYQWIRTGLFL